MNKLKKFLITFIILITSGCSVEYNLNINEDNSVSETVVASEVTTKMESLTRFKGDTAVNYLFKMFNRNDDLISVTSTSDTYNTYATAKRVYNDIDEYKDSFKSDLFSNINVSKSDNTVMIYAKQKTKLTNDSSYSLIYDDVHIKIKIPYKVIENNADEVIGDTYIWNLSKNDDLKTVKISYLDNNKNNNMNIKINNKIYSISYYITIIGLLALIIIFIIIIVYRKNKKNNIV